MQVSCNKMLCGFDLDVFFVTSRWLAHSLGIPKRFEDFLFFIIHDIEKFKKHLKNLIPAITTTADVQKMRSEINDHKSKGHDGLLKIVGINIGFTSSGLKKVRENLSPTRMLFY